jgi:hypothetical protein
LPVGGSALEACDDRDDAVRDGAPKRRGVDVENGRLTECAVGQDAGLGPRERHRRDAVGAQFVRHEDGRDHLAAGSEQVDFPRNGVVSLQ